MFSVLFGGVDLYHGVGMMEAESNTKLFRGKRGGGSVPSGAVGCTSLFLKEGPVWAAIVENSGRIDCPECEIKLGSYCWSGSQCSCKT